jgi:hypothetical protein
MSGIDEAALMEGIMDSRAQIDFLWQFFVTVHLAVFALLFIYGQAVDRMSLLGKALTAAAVAGFEYINGKALINAYLLTDAMHEQYRASFGQVERFHERFYTEFVLASFADRPQLVLITHTTAIVVIVVAFASQRFLRVTRQPNPYAAGDYGRD